jgi:Fur family ferric uptake transcriptional regulator
MILAAVEAQGDHFTAEDIHAQVLPLYRHLNISTVYRTLDLLDDLGLLAKTDLGDGRTQYHLADNARHHHLVCQSCGAVLELDNSLLRPLRESLLREHGFEANIAHFAIFGLCARCRG